MYKTLEIGKKKYKIEFTIEASLYDDCAESVFQLMNYADGADEVDMIRAISKLPKTVLNMFHAGLLEHHGEEGDGTVKSLADSKKLLKQYMLENDADFNAVSDILLNQMGEDGFFKMLGLDMEVNQTKETKKPQDHKRKTTKAQIEVLEN